MRRFLGIACYVIVLALNGAAVYVSYISYTQKISYQLGFLLFMPIFIATYWFSTFFSQLTSGTDKNGKPYMNKLLRRILSDISTVLSIALLGYWAYMFATRSLYHTSTGNITMN